MAKTGFEGSGNILTFKATGELVRGGWTVLPSAYYSDDFTDKPREIDLIASKIFEIKSMYPPYRVQHRICIRLFIECKYLPTNYGFWFGGRDEERISQMLKSRVKLLGHDFNPDNHVARHHYYSNLLFAKAHDRPNASNQDKDLVFNAITQVLNSEIYFRGSNVNALLVQLPGARHHVVDYTVVLINDLSYCKSLQLDEHDHVKVGEITDNFIYEVNYSYPALKSAGGGIEYSLVDFISLDKLKDFFHSIEQDVGLFRDKIGIV